mmetsp:Transcript_53243/g.130472  ORF Transcript_53243/g.130472 Transcript_53243/m.130472 type:complete len:354 (-) Transcript_53243:23-1084(-)|eukprot:CAMPEP_0198315296 /NCGR_PEP_ID=MMETSP1450-20131203/5622_1 /TAXON_ID=753684 ORGANISM="Madagascaria erythrocladiodes, Strain CCMP3234" /NCGR_SAMPLE_ID=MMETSP1450 /ASSEMBLY_ACC=CAM_ASM_001115 /LENGTH=353 /DNA_ID=CAMNT_0044018405 /DNA_START=54 /DNA_END=1115 /DNA_ORIENTATION=+
MVRTGHALVGATGGLSALGAGGRSSVSGVVAAVFGSTGFLGRYVVNQLGRIGSQVVAPWRGDELNFRHLKPMGDLGQIVPMQFELRDSDSLRRVLAPANAVINLLGKPYPTRYYSLHDANATSAEIIASHAKDAGISTFVQLSCARPDPNSPSQWIRAKTQAENTVRKLIPSATIVRATDVFGNEDRFLSRMARAVASQPVVPLINDGASLVQPVYVGDVANVVTAAVRDHEAFAGRVVELGGPTVYTVRDIFEFVLQATKRSKYGLPVPRSLAEAIFAVLQTRLPFINGAPEFTRDDVRREISNVVLAEHKGNCLRFDDVDVVPQDVMGDLGTEALRQFRRGGDRSSLFYMD